MKSAFFLGIRHHFPMVAELGHHRSGVLLASCRCRAVIEAMLPVDAAKYTGGDPEMALSMADAGGSAWGLWKVHRIWSRKTDALTMLNL